MVKVWLYPLPITITPKLYQEYRKSKLIKKKEKDELINDTNNSVLSLDEQIKKLEDKLKEHSQKADEYIEQVGKPIQDLQIFH